MRITNVLTLIGTMKQILLSSLFLLFAVSLSARIYYVRANAAGSGNSWNDASPNLQSVLAIAEPGDEIWVAAGTYTPTQTNDRHASFVIRDGISLYGGFQGWETERSMRDWAKYPTILSGEIGGPALEDNSFNIIYTRNVGPGTTINGFIIHRGNADGQVSKGQRTRGGGGWFDEATNGGVSQPVIANCTFLENQAMEGGAFFGSGQNGSSRPTFSNCHFLKNKAKVDGGAIYSDGRDGSTNQFALKNCRFEDNYSTYGAGIYLENGSDLTGLVVDRCVFINNVASLWGGGIYYNFPPPGGYFEFQIEDCLFEKNYPTDVNKNRFLNNTGRDLAKR